MSLLHPPISLQRQPSRRCRRTRGTVVVTVLLSWWLSACGSTVSSAATSDAQIERVLFAMGTDLHLLVTAADRATALNASEVVVRAIEATEARLSTWREDSELSRLNRTPLGQPFELSAPTARELARALELARITDGAFDPTVGALIEAWDLRGNGRVPSDDELAAALARTGFEHFELNGNWITRHADVQLDAGAFGKGAGLDAALLALADTDAVHARINLGGQIALLGSTRQDIEIAHPLDRPTPAAVLSIDHGSVATTGNSERSVQVDGTRIGHVLDPRTGRPARDFGSSTVVAASALDADALATAAFVLGPASPMFEARGDRVLWILATNGTDSSAVHTSNLTGHVRLLKEHADQVPPDGDTAGGIPRSTN